MDLHIEWYKTVLMRRYASFSGRAGKREFWTFTLMNMAISFILGILTNSMSVFGYLTGLFSLIIFIPSLAVTVRRLHDIGKSGWWYLISLIPLLGTLYLIYLLLKSSQPMANKYGIEAPVVPDLV